VIVGSSTSYTATVTAVNGFTGTVSLSVSGLPTRHTALQSHFDYGSGSSTLSVSTSSSTLTGTYPLTITRYEWQFSAPTTVTLTVARPSAGFQRFQDLEHADGDCGRWHQLHCHSHSR